MITICKHQIYPHCTIVEGLQFKQCFFQSAMIQKVRFPPVSISKLLRGLCYQRHKAPGSLLLCETTKMFISFDS